MIYVTLIAMLALLQFMFFGGAVGQARGRTGVAAPAVTGDESFERYYRVHQNTLEQLIVFLPAIYAFGYYLHALSAVALGIVFLIGRTIYFRAYTSDPASRGLGFMLSFVPNAILTLGAIVGIGIKIFMA